MAETQSARVTMTGEVLGIQQFKFTRPVNGIPTEQVGHEVTLLQRANPKDPKSVPLMVQVAVWNGQLEQCKPGATVTLNVVVSLRQNKDAQGRPYPPRLGVNAY